MEFSNNTTNQKIGPVNQRDTCFTTEPIVSKTGFWHFSITEQFSRLKRTCEKPLSELKK